MMSCPYKNRLFRKLTVMSYCIFTAALTINIEFWLFGRYKILPTENPYIFGTTTWPPYQCLRKSTWRTWRHCEKALQV